MRSICTYKIFHINPKKQLQHILTKSAYRTDVYNILSSNNQIYGSHRVWHFIQVESVHFLYLSSRNWLKSNRTGELGLPFPRSDVSIDSAFIPLCCFFDFCFPFRSAAGRDYGHPNDTRGETNTQPRTLNGRHPTTYPPSYTQRVRNPRTVRDAELFGRRRLVVGRTWIMFN